MDEAAAASYELSDAQYAANEVEATWVTALLGTLVGCLQWLQPMLTPGNFDALVASLLDKARAPARCPSAGSRSNKRSSCAAPARRVCGPCHGQPAAAGAPLRPAQQPAVLTHAVPSPGSGWARCARWWTASRRSCA